MSVLSAIQNGCREIKLCTWPMPHAVFVRLLFYALFFLLLGACALSARYLAVLIRDLLLPQL